MHSSTAVDRAAFAAGLSTAVLRPVSMLPLLGVLLLGVLAALSTSVATAQPLERSGGTFRVFYHGRDEGVDGRRMTRRALGAAETVVPIARRVFGRVKVERLLMIHLYRETARYVRVEGRITGGVFRHNLAFSSFLSKRAHVAVQPQCDPAVLREMGLPRLTLRQIAHEAAHLYCFAAQPSYRYHPEWFSEGGAMWIADRAMRRKSWAETVERDPSTSMRIFLAQTLVRKGRLPSIGDVLRGNLDELHAEERYAIHWLWFRMLKQRAWQQRFDWVLREAQTIEATRDFSEQLRRRFIQAFPESEFPKLDEAFRRHVRRFKPEWEEHVPGLQVDGTTWWQAANPDEHTAAWRLQPIVKKRATISGHLTILPSDHDCVRLLLGRDGERYWAVTFSLSRGVGVARHGDRGWVVVANAPAPFPTKGATIALRVEHDTIEVSVAGRQRLQIPLGDLSIRGGWGIAADEGSAARWERMRASR